MNFLPFFSRAFRCAVKLLVCALSSFFLEALRVMSFLLGTPFILSHKLEYVVASFSSNSKKVFNFFLYFFLDQVTVEYSIIQLQHVCKISIIHVAIEDPLLSMVIA